MLAGEYFVSDFIFLECIQRKDTTSQNGPNFLFLKLPILIGSLIDLIKEIAIRILPNTIYLIDIGTQMIILLGLELYNKPQYILIRCVRCSSIS